MREDAEKNKYNLNDTYVTSLYWKPSLTINLVDDQSVYARGSISPDVAQMLHLQIDEKSGKYFPPFFFNEFWLLKEYLVVVNDTVENLNLTMSFYCIPLWKLTIMSQMDKSFAMQESMGASGEEEKDEFKVSHAKYQFGQF